MGAARVHPTDQVLRAYGLGQLDDASSETIGRHLDDCRECASRAAGASPDSFLGRLRRAHTPDAAPAVRSVADDMNPVPGRAATEPTPPDGTVPAELKDNIDYEIIRELSGGGMGLVYLARNRLMGRYEVLKLIGQEIIECPGIRDRFQGEIRAVARLRHPNIVTAYSAFRAGTSLVLAMEYIDGFDLASRVKTKGPMPVRHACYFVYQAALGLQHAHEAGLVHRDIKPANLMLTQKGGKALIKVLDFGLARAQRGRRALNPPPSHTGSDVAEADDLTLSGQLLGTPDFIAPEQIADPQNVDILADIYSLGCTLYFLLSGSPPFQSSTLSGILEAHRSTDARMLNFVRPEVSVELAAIVSRMMAKDKDRRFQTPAEVAQGLLPFFTPRTAVSVSPNLALDPLVPTVADRSQSEPDSAAPDFIRDRAESPGRGPGMWSSLMEFKKTESDANAVAIDVELGAAPRRRRTLRLAFFAWTAFVASIFAAVEFSKRFGNTNRERPTMTVAAQDAGLAPSGAHDAIAPPEHATQKNGPTITPANKTIPVESTKKDSGSQMAAAAKNDRIKTASPNLASKSGRRGSDRDRRLEPEPETTSVETSVIERLQLLPHFVNKSMRWRESIYVLDAEDDVGLAAAAVAESWDQYLLASRRLENLRDSELEKTLSIATLKREEIDLGQQESALRQRMQVLSAMSTAKRDERRSYGFTSAMSTYSPAFRAIDEEIKAIDGENRLLGESIREIQRQRQLLKAQLGVLAQRTNGSQQIKDIQTPIGWMRDQYVLKLEALRDTVDVVNRLYRDILDDTSAKTTVETKNQSTSGRRWELGPSPRFREVERKLKLHEAWLKAASTPRGKRAAPKLPPSFARD